MEVNKSNRNDIMNNQVITPAQYLMSNIRTKPNTRDIPILINITSQVSWKSLDILEAVDRLSLLDSLACRLEESGKHSLPKNGLVG